MAEMVTGTTTGFVNMERVGDSIGDVRREQAEQSGDIRREQSEQSGDIRREQAQLTTEAVKESIKGDFAAVIATKDARSDVGERINSASARDSALQSAYFIAGQQAATDAAAALASLKASQDLATSRLAGDIAAASERTAAASALATTNARFDIITSGSNNTMALLLDGGKTRELVNAINLQNLQTSMINQNSQLVAGGLAYHGLGLAYGGVNAAYQSANTTNAINAFQSQIASQGVVNTGTMSGTNQTASPTTIR